jgi:peptidoglycan/LPS O-acetylase OafA/YrhL
MVLTRDGALLWCVALAALVAYLVSVGTPPTHWTYAQWLQFASAIMVWVVGKLQTSPLPSKEEVVVNQLGQILTPRKD